MIPFRILAALLLSACAAPARAEGCADPDALGVSRIIAVDPRAHPAVGSQQFSETLPLKDHEIVLTFDDGPIPKFSDRVLDALAAQCVKATFFEVGEMAKLHPEGIRRLFADGHTVGTHSYRHPLTLGRASEQTVAKEVDGGIEAVAAAAGAAGSPAPFFRSPGLAQGRTLERLLAARGLMNWSVDLTADDWHRIDAAKVAELAISRIERRGRGILLLHDIHERTVEALPVILRGLKARGYRIVHVVPATADVPETPTEPAEWLAAPQEQRPVASAGPAQPDGNAGAWNPEATPSTAPSKAPEDAMPAIDTTGGL